MKYLTILFLCLCLNFLFLNSSSSAVEKQKVILDCDLGGDIDDAFALALVITSPEFEVLGLVMDHGLTKRRADIACRILYETGMEHIPVVVGRQTAHVVGETEGLAERPPQTLWADGFTKVKPIRMSAADFIIQELRKYPHEVILFTVGPVPNMRDVIEKDPEALKLAKRIYSMFGSFYMGYERDAVPDAEWNVRADVESAKMFAASGASITYAGLDVTTFVKLNADNRLKLLMRQSPLTDALCGLYSLWGNETPTLYDVVAVGMALWPELFQTRTAHVRVIDGGYTVIDESREPNCEVGMSINTNEFLKRVMERYLRQNMSRE